MIISGRGAHNVESYASSNCLMVTGRRVSCPYFWKTVNTTAVINGRTNANLPAAWGILTACLRASQETTTISPALCAVARGAAISVIYSEESVSSSQIRMCSSLTHYARFYWERAGDIDVQTQTRTEDATRKALLEFGGVEITCACGLSKHQAFPLWPR